MSEARARARALQSTRHGHRPLDAPMGHPASIATPDRSGWVVGGRLSLTHPARLAQAAGGGDLAALEALAAWVREHLREPVLARLMTRKAEAGEDADLAALAPALSVLSADAVRCLTAPPPRRLPELKAIACDGEDWHEPPPERTWLVRGWLPEAELALLYGPGEVGKSLLALQVARALATDRAGWPAVFAPDDPEAIASALPLNRAPVRVVYAGWEDSADELHRRGHRMAAARRQDGRQDVAMAQGASRRFRFLPMRGRGPVHGPDEAGSRHISTVPALTRQGAELREYYEKFEARLLILDPLSLAFATPESDRALVSHVLGDWSGWVLRTGCAVLLVAHPNRGGTHASSQAWQGLCRSMVELAAPTADRFPELEVARVAKGARERIAVISRVKSSYAGRADDEGDRPLEQGVWLRMRHGAVWEATRALRARAKDSGRRNGRGGARNGGGGLDLGDGMEDAP